MSTKENDIIFENQREHLEELRQDVLDFEKTIMDSEKVIEEEKIWLTKSKENLQNAEIAFKDYKKEIGLIK